MKKILVILGIVSMVLYCDAITLSVQKTRAINKRPAKENTFSKQWSRHFYEIKISNVKISDTNSLYSIKILPIFKFCKNGSSFPFFPDIAEYSDIKLDIRKQFSCVYISPLTLWVNDNWKFEDGSHVGEDLSKGIVNSSILIELWKDGEDKPIKTWSNSPLPYCRTTIINADIYIDKKHPALKRIIENDIKDDFIEENSRIETGTWKEFSKK